MKVSIFFRMNPFLCSPVEEWPDSFEGEHQVLWMWVIFLVDPFIAAYAFVPASVMATKGGLLPLVDLLGS